MKTTVGCRSPHRWWLAISVMVAFAVGCSGGSSDYIFNARLEQDGSLCVSQDDRTFVSASPIGPSPPTQDSVDGTLVVSPEGTARFDLGTERDRGRSIELVESTDGCEG